MSHSGTAEVTEDMSSATAPTPGGVLRKRIFDLVDQGCEADDVNLISQAFTLSSTSSPTASRSTEQLQLRTISRVFSRNAPKVLAYILTHGVDVKDIRTGKIALAAYERGKFPKSLVEVLLAHGWDINERQREQPLLWQVVYDGDAVTWCLEHGANVLPKGQRPWPVFDINNAKEFAEYFNHHSESSHERTDSLYDCPPILELAARQSTVATFELLRSKGAPLGWRVLHKAAAGRACLTREEKDPKEEEGRQLQLSDRERARTCEERMAMVRYLVDTLKIDVNVRDQPRGWRLGNFWGRPLHYIAHESGSRGDCREVTLFLIERGADPELLEREGGMTPIALGKANFRDVIKEWRLMQASEASKS